MFASPSICPPPRKNASTRPCAARSNVSTPPSVKSVCLREPRIVSRSAPPASSRASNAADPGIGDALPMTTLRQPASSRAIVAIRISVGETLM